MALLTVSFIDESGFKTWLTPTVKIIDAETWANTTHNMTEIHTGNYVYDFTTYNESRIYFFNYDAWTDTVINRYQSVNNNDVKVVHQLSWGWTNAKIEDEKKKEKEFIDKVVEWIKKEMTNSKYDINTIEEKLGTIVDEIKNNAVEIDYGIIDQSIEESTKDIKNTIKWIKIPKYNEEKIINQLVKEIKSIDLESCKVDINPILNNLEKIWLKIDEEFKMNALENLRKIQWQLKSFESEVEDMTKVIWYKKFKPSEDDLRELMVEMSMWEVLEDNQWEDD